MRKRKEKWDADTHNSPSTCKQTVFFFYEFLWTRRFSATRLDSERLPRFTVSLESRDKTFHILSFILSFIIWYIFWLSAHKLVAVVPKPAGCSLLQIQEENKDDFCGDEHFIFCIFLLVWPLSRHIEVFFVLDNLYDISLSQMSIYGHLCQAGVKLQATDVYLHSFNEW